MGVIFSRTSNAASNFDNRLYNYAGILPHRGERLKRDIGPDSKRRLFIAPRFRISSLYRLY